MNDRAQAVSQTILKQLGGQRFVTMTGANSFTYAANGALTFRIPRRPGPQGRIRKVKIILNDNDLYVMEFYKVEKDYSVSLVERVEDIYADQLETIFTKHTGLHTCF